MDEIAFEVDFERCKQFGKDLWNLVYPDLDHGIDGIRWINACVESADKGAVWVDVE